MALIRRGARMPRREGKTCVIGWHMRGEDQVELRELLEIDDPFDPFFTCCHGHVWIDGAGTGDDLDHACSVCADGMCPTRIRWAHPLRWVIGVDPAMPKDNAVLIQRNQVVRAEPGDTWDYYEFGGHSYSMNVDAFRRMAEAGRFFQIRDLGDDARAESRPPEESR
jgi:hypothetical protein